MVWAQLCLSADVHICEVQHIPGEENHVCDSLSRRGSDHPLSVADHACSLGAGGGLVFDAKNDPDMMTLIQRCNPAVEAGRDCEFAEFWTSIRRAPDSFVAHHPLRAS